MFPKLVGLDTDGTIFTGNLDQKQWGKGPNAYPKLADNIKHIDDFRLQDKSNRQNEIRMSADIPRIVNDILKNGASLAIVSRNTSRTLCDRALYYFKAADPHDGEKLKPIIELVRYDEVTDEPKTEHFKRIHKWSKYDYSDMVLFDDESANNIVQNSLGVHVENCSPQAGLTWEVYRKGIEGWRTKKSSNDDSGKPAPLSTTTLNIAHFNDVYQVSDQKIHPGGKDDATETINVTKFATSLFDVTSNWKRREDGSKEGLTVFSGDVFSPSTESSVTRGKHMPPILNGLRVDIGVAGNHEFDFGYPQLKNLLAETHFPWLLSNIFDTTTGKVPEPLKNIHVVEKAGIRIGLIGLVEKDWIATITGWPKNFEYQDMEKIGKELSVKLRDPAGEYKCEFIVALTHSRIPNDIKLAKALFALSPAAQSKTSIASEHGVDLLLGGHDHVYWISKGVTDWDGYDLQSFQPDAKDDDGDVLVVKSGTDFQDFSEIVLTLKDTPPGSVRRKLISAINGKRHVTRGSTAVDENIKVILDNELKTLNESLSRPICITDVQLDVKSVHVRLQESAIGNWVADCLRHAYDEALVKLGPYSTVDGVIICTGDFRGDGVYEPGNITLGNLKTILPYSDPTVVVELDANALWDTLESGLSLHPAQEGRFPTISGLRVSWDSRKPPGERILGIWLLEESDGKLGPDGKPAIVDKEEVLRTNTERKYLIMCGEYMWTGGDGYDVLKGKKLVIAAENGQPKTTLIRKFLLGAQYLNQKLQEKPEDRSMNPLLQKVMGSVEGELQKWQSLPYLPQIPGLHSLPKPSLPSLPSSIPSSPFLSPISTPSFSPHSFASFSIGRPTLSNLRSHVPSLDITVTMSNVASSASASVSDLSSVGDSISDYAQKVLEGVVPAIRWLASRALFTAALLVAEQEDMGLLDSYERQRARMQVELMRADPSAVNVNLRLSFPMFFSGAGKNQKDIAAEADEEEAKINDMEANAERALPVIHPFVDGRLKNVASK